MKQVGSFQFYRSFFTTIFFFFHLQSLQHLQIWMRQT